jgi:dynein heavy chain
MQVLGNFKLVDELKTYDVEHTKSSGAANAKKKMQKIAKDFKETAPEDLPKLISGKSLAVGALYAWTDATLKCYDINKTVEPKKLKAKQMRAAKEKGEKELAATEALVAELTKTLAEANAAKKEKEDELNELQRISAEMTRKLNAASKLITGLGGE